MWPKHRRHAGRSKLPKLLGFRAAQKRNCLRARKKEPLGINKERRLRKVGFA
jgi:hypothetical protein